MTLSKNDRIRETIKETRLRHSQMRCVVFECKAVDNKLNCLQKEQVNQYFKEAKWLRNSIIAGNHVSRKELKVATVKVGDQLEERELSILGSQVRQDIYASVKSEIKGLSTKKKKGDKVGALKFKNVCNSTPLRQYGTTYRIEGNRIKVQNIDKSIYVRGLRQIPEEAEIANARMVRKPSGLYFHITCFLPKEEDFTDGSIGIDSGIQHNLTLSNGDTYDISVPESKMIKLYSKRLNRSFKRNGNKHTENHKKRKSQLRKAYEKMTNIKQNQVNQIVHEILGKYGFIAIQDEMISSWHKGLFGKQVQHSCMGSIKAKLKNNFKVHVVERSFPSTQLCPICGCLTKHPLKEREYNCKHCGYHHPSRDIKSAQSILDKALEVSMERRAHSPVELNSDSVPPIHIDGTLRVGATI